MYIPYLNTDGLDAYRREVINGVSWFRKNISNVTIEGLKTADVITIRIPSKATVLQYVNYLDYLLLSDISGFWTLKEGMTIVHGNVSDTEENATPAKLLKKYGRDKVMTVLSFTDNCRKLEPHFKVVGQ